MKKTKKTAKQISTKGHIRIISGTHRGRKLPVLLSDGLRPTTDRIKETVFNWLAPYIQDSVCLDCFAGSGSLGFEAISRGAQHVTFVELEPLIARQLRENKTLLKVENADVIQGNSLEIIKNNSVQFSLVFIDPPFRKGIALEMINLLVAENCLTENALIYIEMEAENKLTQLPSQWCLIKEKTSGQVSYQLFQQTENYSVVD